MGDATWECLVAAVSHQACRQVHHQRSGQPWAGGPPGCGRRCTKASDGQQKDRTDWVWVLSAWGRGAKTTGGTAVGAQNRTWFSEEMEQTEADGRP